MLLKLGGLGTLPIADLAGVAGDGPKLGYIKKRYFRIDFLFFGKRKADVPSSRTRRRHDLFNVGKNLLDSHVVRRVLSLEAVDLARQVLVGVQREA